MRVRVTILNQEPQMYPSPEKAFEGISVILKEADITSAQALYLVLTGDIKIKRMSK